VHASADATIFPMSLVTPRSSTRSSFIEPSLWEHDITPPPSDWAIAATSDWQAMKNERSTIRASRSRFAAGFAKTKRTASPYRQERREMASPYRQRGSSERGSPGEGPVFSAAMSKAHSTALVAAIEPATSFARLPETEQSRRALCFAKFTQRLLREEVAGLRCECGCVGPTCECADKGLTKTLAEALRSGTALSSLASLAERSAVGMHTVLSTLTNLSALGPELRQVLAEEAAVRAVILSGLLHDPVRSAMFALPCAHSLRGEPPMQRALCANAMGLTARLHTLGEEAARSQPEDHGEDARLVHELVESMRESTARRMSAVRILRDAKQSHHNRPKEAANMKVFVWI